MHKRLALALTAAITALSLCACGSAETAADEVTEAQEGPAESSWQSEGQPYKLQKYASGADGESKAAADAVAYQGEAYIVIEDSPIPTGYCIERNGETVYSSENYYFAAAAGESGIWILDYNDSALNSGYWLTLISESGSTVQTIYLSQFGESFTRRVVCSGDCVYLVTESGRLLGISLEDQLAELSIPEGAYAAAAADGQIYIIEPASEETRFYAVNSDMADFSEAFTLGGGSAFSGGGDNYLLFKNETGLYSVSADGAEDALVIWADCGISLDGLYNISPLKDGQFLCMCNSGPYILAPADALEVTPRTALTLAAINPNTALKNLVAEFNNSGSGYTVQLVDYSDGGAPDADSAQTKLNTEIMSGKRPDMLCFGQINPYPYIGHGLLAELSELLNADGEIAADDLAIKNALSLDGKIYYLSGEFSFETLVGRYSDFGERFGWTLAEYLDIEQDLDSDIDVIYNMTTDTFIDRIMSRYIRSAVDWESGTCDFDNAEFTALLTAGGQIRETPENSSDMSYGYGPTKVGEGTMVTSLSWVDSVWKLAYEEQAAGCKLSFIGWPTADGSCGTDAHLVTPIGIMNSSANIGGCLEFIKFMLLNPGADKLPVYSQILRERLEAAEADGSGSVQLSADDAGRFLALVSEIDNAAIYDDAILNIIWEESEAFFAGDKSAEEAVKLIQSRASIYVAEQS